MRANTTFERSNNGICGIYYGALGIEYGTYSPDRE